MHDALTESLATGYALSSTVRGLVHELEDSDVIVHIVAATSRSGPPGSLQFITRGGGFRFLRITVDATLSPRRRMALLAHELQHAVEVARASNVTDADSLASLYRRIGWSVTGHASHYETAAAQRTGARVFAEVGEGRRTATW